MDTTVTTKPKHGTVEYYAASLRLLFIDSFDMVECCALDRVRSVMEDQLYTAEERVSTIRNVLAAVEVVRAELAEAKA